MKTIAITNQKGGVAKTTTSWSVGVGLHKKGNKVLLVDLDAQTNLSFTAKVDLLNLEHTLYDCFNGKAKINDCIITIDSGLDIIVGGIDLASADRDFNKLGRERMLKKALEPISNDYDFCIIDIGIFGTTIFLCSSKNFSISKLSDNNSSIFLKPLYGSIPTELKKSLNFIPSVSMYPFSIHNAGTS